MSSTNLPRPMRRPLVNTVARVLVFRSASVSVRCWAAISVFTIHLPANARDLVDDSEPASAPVPADASDSEQCKVLVIDDDPVVRDLISRHLVKEGFQVVSASAGSEGLSLARKIRPDVISLDVLMPGMDGWSVLEQLKEDVETADTPVIMVSILDEKKIGYTLGATDYLIKPIDRDRLLQVMNRHCRGRLDGPVLLVDDDEAARDITGKILESHDLEVIQAGNGKEAIDILEQVLPQIILLDLMMPVMDGFEFLEAVRERAEWRAIPVIVITAKDLTEADHERLNGMVRSVIGKGKYSESDLLSSLRTVLRQATAGGNNSINAIDENQPEV